MEATRARQITPALYIWLTLFFVLNIADLVSTYVALGIGMREGNPLMSTLLSHYGFAALIAYKVAVILVVTIGVVLLRRFNPRMAKITIVVCNVLVFAAVFLNILQFNLG
ncbi:MAG TPA: DUF5658 family protein [Ktedonobacterales bacterium]|jgi:hypothetical protein